MQTISEHSFEIEDLSISDEQSQH